MAITEVPLVAQWKQTWLVTMRMRVRSLAPLSRSGIRCCREPWCRWQTRLWFNVAMAVGVGHQLWLILPVAWELPYTAGVGTTAKKAIINKSTKDKCWRGCREKGTFLHCWWQCKLVQPLWKTSMEVPQKTKYRTAMWSSNPSPRNISEQSYNTKRYMYLYKQLHSQ